MTLSNKAGESQGAARNHVLEGDRNNHVDRELDCCCAAKLLKERQSLGLIALSLLIYFREWSDGDFAKGQDSSLATR
jgi:hypothetical protein